jgi:8-oxo-dGTP pyrophosphatase MutT (NUDIX family)
LTEPGPPLARFVSFHEGPEAASFGGEKLGFAVMITDSAEGIVLVFNRWRGVWELPGGLVDPGESPRSTAVRELREEAGCEAHEVRWLGVAEVDDGRRHFGGVFRCSVTDIPPKIPDEEIGGVACWLADRPPPGLGATDEALLERFGTRA